MAKNLSSSDQYLDEEDYIDMEVINSSTIFCFTSPPFEFQKSSTISLDKDQPTTSPADELFYKGNLLPLHLPPRMQMVQDLLLGSNPEPFKHKTEYSVSKTEDSISKYRTPFISTTTSTTSTPYESCNISPSESCRVSTELTQEEYFSDFSTELRRFIEEKPKKSGSKKINLIKSSSLGLKLKASKDFFKSLFYKSGCKNESCTKAGRVGMEESVLKAKECLNKYVKVTKNVKVTKKAPFGQIQRVQRMDKEKMNEDGHRRSFSGAINRHLATKCSCCSSSSCCSVASPSSSFSSVNSSGYHEIHLLKRSHSANSDSIQGAIAHCKQSQQVLHSRKTVSDVGFFSFPACEDQER